MARVRFVAVSATVPNMQDIADWLDVPPHGVFRFGDELRPCPLTVHVCVFACDVQPHVRCIMRLFASARPQHWQVRGYSPAKNDFLFERRLTEHVYSIICEFGQGKPALVFCRCAHMYLSTPLIIHLTCTNAPTQTLVQFPQGHSRHRCQDTGSQPRYLCRPHDTLCS